MTLTFGIILSSSPYTENWTNSQIYPATLDENKNSKVHTIKILVGGSASALIVRKGILYERYKILKDERING